MVSSARHKEDNTSVDFDQKKLIMESFRSLVYAHRKNTYDDNLKQFEDLAKDVEVKVGNADNFVSLNQYFIKNWESCQEMWSMFSRRRIVGIEDINTNNHLERMWRTLKDYLKQMTSGAMTISKAVLKLVRYCEMRLEERYTWDRRHKMRIFDEDPDIKEEYVQAAKKLNDRGMGKFVQSVEKMKDKESLMEVVVTEEGGESIKEVFRKKVRVTEEKKVKEEYDGKNEDENGNILMEETDSAEKEKGEDEEFDDDGVDSFKIYQTSIGGCNCASKFRSGCPCRHILFLRKTKNINLFDSSLFSLHFSKERNLDLEKEHEDLKFDDDQSIEVDKDNSQHIIEGDSENEETLKTLTREQKYKIVGPLCERLIDAMIKCGTVRVEQNLPGKCEEWRVSF